MKKTRIWALAAGVHLSSNVPAFKVGLLPHSPNKQKTHNSPLVAWWRVALGSLMLAGGLLAGSSALAAPDLTVRLMLNLRLLVTGSTDGPNFTGDMSIYSVIVHNN